MTPARARRRRRNRASRASRPGPHRARRPRRAARPPAHHPDRPGRCRGPARSRRAPHASRTPRPFRRHGRPRARARNRTRTSRRRGARRPPAGAARSWAPPGAGAALAFVHRLHPRDGDAVTLLDEIVRYRCGLGHALGPRVAVTEEVERGVDREVARRHDRSRSSHATGNDTGTPGLTRGLYAAITVPPPTRVGSTNTLPPRSSFMNAVVATSGIEPRDACRDRPGRGRRVLHRAASRSIGTKTCNALGATRLDRAVEPGVGEHVAHEVRHLRPPWRTRRPRAGRGRERGASCGRDGRPRTSAGWYSIARWFANQSSVRRSLQSAYGHLALRRLRPEAARSRIQSGVYFGTFFCMNASWPRCTRITDSGRSASTGMIRSRTRRGSRRGRAWSRRPRRTTAGRGW